MTRNLRFARLLTGNSWPGLAPIAFAVVVLISVIPVRAEWVTDGTLVSPETGDRHHLAMLPDGDHGAFIGWKETAYPWNIVVARIDVDGVVLWTRNVAPGYTIQDPILTPVDGGGVQMTGRRNVNYTGEVVIQRVDAQGNLIFPPPWKVVASTPLNSGVGFIAAILLNDGHTQIAWLDGSIAWGQRLDAQGNPLWEEGGRQLVPPEGPYYGKDKLWLVPGTDGAFFLAWNRVYLYNQETFLPGYVRRYGADGVAGPPGVAIPYDVALSSDGANGVMATWTEGSDIAAERVFDDGTPAWGPTTICGFSGEQKQPRAIPDGTGGAFFTWNDTRNGSLDVYSQRVDGNGTLLWASGGVPVVAEPGDQYSGMFMPDGAGGAIIAWSDWGPDADLYAQRLGPAGDPLWGGSGVAVSTATGQQGGGLGMLDGLGGVLVSWGDTRYDATNYRVVVFAQRLSLADGSWGSPVAVAISNFSAGVRGTDVVLNATLRSDLGVDFVRVYRAVDDGSLVLRDTNGPPTRDRFEYVDDDVLPATRYRYQLAVGDADGEFMSPVVTVTTPGLAFALEQNQPNPFNPETTIRFVIPETGRATVSVFGADGRLVRTIYDEIARPGTHEARWDGRDAGGRPVSSGVYFCRLHAGKQETSRKLTLLK